MQFISATVAFTGIAHKLVFVIYAKNGFTF